MLGGGPRPAGRLRRLVEHAQRDGTVLLAWLPLNGWAAGLLLPLLLLLLLLLPLQQHVWQDAGWSAGLAVNRVDC